ncbi:MAG: hypothetical protein J2P36_09915, partial [Ktedonobacteraceae bacterium]|nr:hypothetical protein [Ktedonobacteraceae bacterium]
TWLAPSAILCIRALRDPLPGGLRLELSQSSFPAWEWAICAALDGLARRAAWPARGPVPANAEAVIFADRAELLACLASDWCAGEITQHWWWSGLLRESDAGNSVLPAWLETPAYIPAALQHLSTMRKVVPFVRLLRVHDALTMLQHVIRSFALHDLERLPVREPPFPQTTGTATQSATVAETSTIGPSSGLAEAFPGTGTTAPWRQWVPESSDPGLRLEQHCLLGIGLMLQRQPAIARTTAFTCAVRDWHQAAQLTSTSSPVPTQETPARSVQGQSEGACAGTTQPIASQTPFTRPVPMLAGAQAAAALAWDADNTSPAPSLEAPGANIELQQVIDVAETSADTPGETRNRPYVDHWQNKEPLFDVTIETAVGGVFYLVNLGLFLNLYGDFTTPLQPGIALNIWDFVALAGQQLLEENLLADQLWELLAQLAGRNAQDAPGCDFEPPEEWRLPGVWLTAFPEQVGWLWIVEQGRLRVKHPSGFLLLDLFCRQQNPWLQLTQELQAYEELRDIEPEFVREAEAQGPEPSPQVQVPQKVARWLDWLMPYIRARLCRALDVTVPGEMPRKLCEQRARVLVTATHIDIFFSLAELPIEIRIAGLDRDPGWIPAAGRFIAFHFE